MKSFTSTLLLLFAALIASFHLASGHALSGGHPAMATSDDAGTFQRQDPMKPSWRKPWGRWMQQNRNRNVKVAPADRSNDPTKTASPEKGKCEKVEHPGEILNLPRGGGARLTLNRRQTRNLVGISVAVVVAPTVAIPAVRLAAGVIAGVAILDALDVIRL